MCNFSCIPCNFFSHTQAPCILYIFFVFQAFLHWFSSILSLARTKKKRGSFFLSMWNWLLGAWDFGEVRRCESVYLCCTLYTTQMDTRRWECTRWICTLRSIELFYKPICVNTHVQFLLDYHWKILYATSPNAFQRSSGIPAYTHTLTYTR